MFEFPHRENHEKTSVLAARLAIPEAQHPRVPEPTAQSVLAHSGSPDAAAVGEDAMVLDALKIMAGHDTEAVAVVSAGGVVGIFSERDHARHGLLENRPAKDTPVADIMSRSVADVAPADSLRHCLDLMNERHATHLAVLDQGRLVGLLSRADLLAARVAYLEHIFHETEMDRKLLFLSGTYSC